MEEAVEICKLRLFLKLVAQVERVEDVEPLPDIDFNVRAGNTLVGYATREDVQRALTTATDGRMKLMFEEESTALQRFEERAADVERLFGLFRQQQTELGGQVTAEDKAELRRRLDALDDELNRALAREYGVEAEMDGAYKAWLESHRPFHWFVEFYGIMRRGGFDVMIGNPPYVEYVSSRLSYTPQQLKTMTCGNLYAFVIERCFDALRDHGMIGMIVQLPICVPTGCGHCRPHVSKSSGQSGLRISTIVQRELFDGLEHIRATVFVAQKGQRRIARSVLDDV